MFIRFVCDFHYTLNTITRKRWFEWLKRDAILLFHTPLRWKLANTALLISHYQKRSLSMICPLCRKVKNILTSLTLAQCIAIFSRKIFLILHNLNYEIIEEQFSIDNKSRYKSSFITSIPPCCECCFWLLKSIIIHVVLLQKIDKLNKDRFCHEALDYCLRLWCKRRLVILYEGLLYLEEVETFTYDCF